MRLRLVQALAALSLVAACSKQPPAPAAAGPAPDAAGGAGAAIPAAPAGAELTYVSAVTVLRREPSEAAKAKGASGKEAPNYLAVLHRGEKVAVLETKDDWARVKASDDQEGWVKRGSLLEGQGITEATVLTPTDVFDRPDLLAANAKRKIDPGTLVLVVRSRGTFAEVNVGGSQTAWVLADRLKSGEGEVSVAKLIEKSRWLVRSNRKDEALKLLALAREHFSGVSLVDQLATELGEPPAPAADAVVPAAAEVPGQPAPTAPAAEPGQAAPAAQ